MWRYSSEELTPTEAVTAVAVKGILWLEKCYYSTSISLFLTAFRRFSIDQLPYCPDEPSGPLTRPYIFRKISRIQPEIEPGTSLRRANHYTISLFSLSTFPCIFHGALLLDETVLTL